MCVGLGAGGPWLDLEQEHRSCYDRHPLPKTLGSGSTGLRAKLSLDNEIAIRCF